MCSKPEPGSWALHPVRDVFSCIMCSNEISAKVIRLTSHDLIKFHLGYA